jgi:hypothetical protein
MDILEMGWEGMDWINLAKDRDECKCGSKFYYIRVICFRIEKMQEILDSM